MTDTRYRDAEWLHEQYHEKELSQAEIADKCGVDDKTVRNWMEKHDIEAREPGHNNCRTGIAIQSNDGYRRWNESTLGKHLSVHRLLAVAEYGFDAVCDMHVHHKNGIRWDNRPDNIELMTPSEHASLHRQQEVSDTRYRDAEWLHKQYHEKELTQKEIADKCGVHDTTVGNWMQKHGIEKREPNGGRSDKPTGQLTLDDTRNLESAQTVNQ